MKFTVESIEDNIARLECDGNTPVFLRLECLPDDVKEGDVLSFDGESYTVDAIATAARKRAVFEKFGRLFRKE